jgi:two-component system, OmpR family, sensor histidine kinase KdpD
MARGHLRVYLGAAPGVGKTYAMLAEGVRRRDRGTDVVVGYVEPHGRAATTAQLRDLPVVPRQQLEYRGAVLEEMDLEAVLVRRPQVALVDELAHTNAPGSRHGKRWEDIEELVAAGIDVITTVNVQHLESLNDVVERITGVVQRETVPDAIVRGADQIELVDMSPEALRRRMAHGNIYPPERVDAALANYFRPGNLGALRELALLWVADRVEESLQGYLADHGITDAWETRERIVVGMSGIAEGDHLIRRAARIAGRVQGELIGVHVVAADGLTVTAGDELDRQRQLLVQLGGTYHEVVGDDVAAALAAFATAERATQLVLGASRRGRLTELVRGSPVASVLRHLGSVDVHVIAQSSDESPAKPLPIVRSVSALPWRRKAWGWAVAVVTLPLLTALLIPHREDLSLSTILVLYLVVVVVIAAIGGLVVGLVSAVAALVLENWFFTPPLHTLSVADGEHLVALLAFVAVSALVSLLVGRAVRRSREAVRARAEAEALARTTASLIGDADPLPAVVDQLRIGFGLQAAAVVERTDTGWTTLASSGPAVLADGHPGVAIDLDEAGTRRLVLTGGQLGAVDQHVLRAFADQLRLALERRQLREEAHDAEALAETDALRRSLLQAVSHDLRTPLASIKAAVTSLLQRDVAWSTHDRDDLLGTIDTATDRLDRVVANLLDMSRLQSGALSLRCAPVALEDVVAAALGSIPEDAHRTTVDVPETLPLVEADPALLERAVANVVSNALAWSPPDQPVRIEAAPVQERVCLRVIDRGPGIPSAQRARIFEPFRRLGDRSTDAGVGLGLAVAHGFVTAMHGEISVDDTPGGGLTVTISLAPAVTGDGFGPGAES